MRHKREEMKVTDLLNSKYCICTSFSNLHWDPGRYVLLQSHFTCEKTEALQGQVPSVPVWPLTHHTMSQISNLGYWVVGGGLTKMRTF